MVRLYHLSVLVRDSRAVSGTTRLPIATSIGERVVGRAVNFSVAASLLGHGEQIIWQLQKP